MKVRLRTIGENRATAKAGACLSVFTRSHTPGLRRIYAPAAWSPSLHQQGILDRKERRAVTGGSCGTVILLLPLLLLLSVD